MRRGRQRGHQQWRNYTCNKQRGGGGGGGGGVGGGAGGGGNKDNIARVEIDDTIVEAGMMNVAVVAFNIN